MAAIGVHVVTCTLIDGMHVVTPKGGVASSSGSPNIDAYLEAEAALGYLPTLVTDFRIVTANVADVNNAS